VDRAAIFLGGVVTATLPTFLVIGAMKAGTTSLYEYVRSHPDVFMPSEKELDFFVAEKRWPRGLGWYSEQFAPGAGARARGEASTNYTKDPLFGGVAGRIASALPEARLVYLVRNPIERIRSQYLHSLSAGWERRPIDRAVLEEPQYVDVSRYAHQLERFLEHFSREQILVVHAEDLRNDRLGVVRRVFSFIGVDPGWTPAELDREYHPTGEKPLPRILSRLPGAALAARLAPAPVKRVLRTLLPTAGDPATIAPATEQRLREALRPDVERLRVWLGDEFDGWGIG
jgi:sulfotransferase family protein